MARITGDPAGRRDSKKPVVIPATTLTRTCSTAELSALPAALAISTVVDSTSAGLTARITKATFSTASAIDATRTEKVRDR